MATAGWNIFAVRRPDYAHICKRCERIFLSHLLFMILWRLLHPLSHGGYFRLLLVWEGYFLPSPRHAATSVISAEPIWLPSVEVGSERSAGVFVVVFLFPHLFASVETLGRRLLFLLLSSLCVRRVHPSPLFASKSIQKRPMCPKRPNVIIRNLRPMTDQMPP